MGLVYFYIAVFILIACVATPVTVAVLLRKAGFWNGIMSLTSMIASIVLIAVSLSETGYSSVLEDVRLYWIIPASWTLVFGLFSLAQDNNKLYAIIAMLALAGIFISILIFI